MVFLRSRFNDQINDMALRSASCFTLGIAVVLATCASFSYAGQARVSFPVKPLSIGIHAIQAEVAANEAQRQQGLMHRQKMAANEGMLFVFGAPVTTCMWMKNTFIPLSAAFIDTEGKIVNIEDMQPQSLEPHCGKKRVAYVLEMNQGWFKQRNIKPGMAISGLPPPR